MRMVSGWIPAAFRSSSFNCECVVEAGWIINDFASPTFANKEKILVEPHNFWLASLPAFKPNEKTELVPLGKYFEPIHNMDYSLRLDNAPKQLLDGFLEIQQLFAHFLHDAPF